jgi:hypothetical protein
MVFTDETPFPLNGKYKDYNGLPLKEVPDEILLEIYHGGNINRFLKDYIEENWEAITANVERNEDIQSLIMDYAE